MVQLDGTYEYVSQDNYLEYLKTLIPEETAQKVAASTSPIKISTAAGSITASYGGSEVTFPLGKEFEHTLSIGHTVRTIVSVNGDTITFKTKLNAEGTVTEEKVVKITDSGLTSTSTNSKGAKGVRHYKRV